MARRVAEIANSQNLPVILGGDLDAEPDSGSVRLLTGRQSLNGESTAYVRAWDVAHPGERCVTLDPADGLVASTVPGWPYRQFDHILVRCARDGLASLLVESCERVFDKRRAGMWASDHYGLVAELTARH